MISFAEKAFIEEGCALRIRYDGRGRCIVSVDPEHQLHPSLTMSVLITDTNSFRPMSIEDSIFPHTDGSSRVRISDSVDILCTVKVTSLSPWLQHMGSLT
jgi:hypothetical protein